MKVGEAIRAFRERNGLTQRELAEVMDVTPGNVGQIEKGDISMRSELIGTLKARYPDLWRSLVAIRMAEERAALGLDEHGAVPAPTADAESTLLAVRREIDRHLEELAVKKPVRKAVKSR